MTDNLRENLTELISPLLLSLIFLVVILVFIIVSTALVYHWKNYNIDSTVAKRITKMYFLVSGGFLLVMLTAIIVYSL